MIYTKIISLFCFIIKIVLSENTKIKKIYINKLLFKYGLIILNQYKYIYVIWLVKLCLININFFINTSCA